MKNLMTIFLFAFLSCKLILSPSKRYIIDREGVKSKTGCLIEHMSISQFKQDHNDVNDIRPNDKNEITRYCCWLAKDKKGSSKISFVRANPDYNWFLCKIDTSIIVNDTLSKLSLQDKLAYIKNKKELDNNSIGKESFPFIIQKGYVYQVFGLCDVGGSYFFCIDSNNKLVIQYQEEGPL